ncbi:MAG: cell envelope integrity protein TolA [Gammaproteobacteria bacterium]|nr:cell envelope integrity protein TolA [Gammaproteobacteria bacterium]
MELRLRDVVLALLLHAMVFTFVFVGVRCSRTVTPPAAIEGVLVNEPLAVAPAPKPMPAKPEPKQTPRPEIESPPAPLPPITEPGPVPQNEAVQQPELAAATAAMAKAQRQIQQRAEAAAREQAQREAHEKAQAQQRLELQKQQAAEEKARREARQQQTEARRHLQQQLAAAEAQQNVEQEQNAWSNQLTAAIRGNWVRPPALSDHFNCSVQMELLPNGQVVSVSIRRSCGSPALDDSVVRAVNKSSPLPLPQDPAAFDPRVTIEFCPHSSDCSQ